MRDAIGFGAFFSVFEGGRVVARRARAQMDKALIAMGLSLGDEDDVGRRWPGRLVYVHRSDPVSFLFFYLIEIRHFSSKVKRLLSSLLEGWQASHTA
jgi:hypothetical protein